MDTQSREPQEENSSLVMARSTRPDQLGQHSTTQTNILGQGTVPAGPRAINQRVALGPDERDTDSDDDYSGDDFDAPGNLLTPYQLGVIIARRKRNIQKTMDQLAADEAALARSEGRETWTPGEAADGPYHALVERVRAAEHDAKTAELAASALRDSIESAARRKTTQAENYRKTAQAEPTPAEHPGGAAEFLRTEPRALHGRALAAEELRSQQQRSPLLARLEHSPPSSAGRPILRDGVPTLVRSPSDLRTFARQREDERKMFGAMRVTPVEDDATLIECVDHAARDIQGHLESLDWDYAQGTRDVFITGAAWLTDGQLAQELDREAKTDGVLRAALNTLAGILTARPLAAQSHSVLAAAERAGERTCTLRHIQAALEQEDKTASIIQRRQQIHMRIYGGLAHISHTHEYLREMLRNVGLLEVLNDTIDPAQVVTCFVVHCPDKVAMHHARQRVTSLHARNMTEARAKLQELHRAMVDFATDEAQLERTLAQRTKTRPGGRPSDQSTLRTAQQPFGPRAQGYPAVALAHPAQAHSPAQPPARAQPTQLAQAQAPHTRAHSAQHTQPQAQPRPRFES
jgi:hypothetical protein